MDYLIPALAVILLLGFLIVILRKGREQQTMTLGAIRKDQAIKDRRARLKADQALSQLVRDIESHRDRHVRH